MHLQRRDVHEKARTDELVVHVVIAQHVADVLTEKTLNALSKLLNAIGVLLSHAPSPVRRVGFARLEWCDALLHLEVPGHIRNQIFYMREGLHRLDRYRVFERERIEAGPCTQHWPFVFFRRSGAA